MRICRNQLTDHIAEHFGANPLQVPESSFQPLGLIEIKDHKVHLLGAFPSLLKTNNFNFNIDIMDSVVAQVSDVKTSKVDFKLAFSLLENFLKAFGASSIGIKGALNHSKKMTFSFSNVHRKYFDLIAFGKILSDNALIADTDNISIENIYRDTDTQLALITDALISNNFSLGSFKDNETEADIDIPIIEKYLADAKLELKVKKVSGSEIKFEQKEALTFAFSCIELRIDRNTGKFSRGDWLTNIRSAKGQDNLDEQRLTEDDWTRYSKLWIDDNRANPLMIEIDHAD